MELVLTKGAAVNARNSMGETPLHLASNNRLKGVMELLLAHKADVNVRDKSGLTPLHAAARGGIRK